MKMSMNALFERYRDKYLMVSRLQLKLVLSRSADLGSVTTYATAFKDMGGGVPFPNSSIGKERGGYDNDLNNTCKHCE